jgi:hypothetical protein
MSAPVELSVIVPAHNERPALERLYHELRDALEPLGCAYEVILVDDGSDDGSFEAIEALRRDDPCVRAIRLRRNYGQTAALDAGFRLATGRTIATIDADGENDPADLVRLLARLEAAGGEGGGRVDVVCGWRRGRRDGRISRRLPSWAANRLIALWTGVPIHDCGCALRVYRRSAVRLLSMYADMHRLLPVFAWLHGARIAEVPVAHRERRGGRSHYGLARAWKVPIDVGVLLVTASAARRPVALPLASAGVALALGATAYVLVAADRGSTAYARSAAAGAGSGDPIVATGCALLFGFLAAFLALSGWLGQALLEGLEAPRGADDIERLA